MIEIATHDPAVQAAAIMAVGSVIATVIAASCAAFIGQRITSRKKLAENLETAHADIRFLLAVEKEHCAIHREQFSESFKIRVRDRVRSQGYTVSRKTTLLSK